MYRGDTGGGWKFMEDEKESKFCKSAVFFKILFVFFRCFEFYLAEIHTKCDLVKFESIWRDTSQEI